MQTQLGSPAGEGGLDNIIVTTRRTCLGYCRKPRGGRSTREKNAATATKRSACKQRQELPSGERVETRALHEKATYVETVQWFTLRRGGVCA